MPQIYYSHAIRQAIEEEMERDERVILLGEDIAGYGGAFKTTEGIVDRFGPKRVRNTPISEGGFVGVAVGAALTGLRPIVEIMFMDFITLAMDQLANHAAKLRYQFDTQATGPLVLRTPADSGPGESAGGESVLAEAEVAAQIQQAVKEAKGAVQAPKTVIFTDQLPLTGLGKPDKKALRARYA